MAGVFRALLRLRRRRIVVGRRLAVVAVEFAGGRGRHGRVVRTVLRRPALVQRVMVVLRGRVRRHAQPERETVRGRHRILVVMVVAGRGRRLMVVVTAVEAGLLEIRIHGIEEEKKKKKRKKYRDRNRNQKKKLKNFQKKKLRENSKNFRTFVDENNEKIATLNYSFTLRT